MNYVNYSTNAIVLTPVSVPFTLPVSSSGSYENHYIVLSTPQPYTSTLQSSTNVLLQFYNNSPPNYQGSIVYDITSQSISGGIGSFSNLGGYFTILTPTGDTVNYISSAIAFMINLNDGTNLYVVPDEINGILGTSTTLSYDFILSPSARTSSLYVPGSVLPFWYPTTSCGMPCSDSSDCTMGGCTSCTNGVCSSGGVCPPTPACNSCCPTCPGGTCTQSKTWLYVSIGLSAVIVLLLILLIVVFFVRK